ncbi:unnamed protein product [Merluccius merluccius]
MSRVRAPVMWRRRRRCGLPGITALQLQQEEQQQEQQRRSPLQSHCNVTGRRWGGVEEEGWGGMAASGPKPASVKVTRQGR